MTLLVSACLLGRACRYDGASKPNDAVRAAVDAARAAGQAVVPVCPEEAGGLGTPRPAATLVGGDGAAVWAGAAAVQRVADGADLTAAFQAGARACARPGATAAILKARSPSCGVGCTGRDGGTGPGDGVFAALLRARGVALCTDEDLGLPPAPAAPALRG